MRVSIYQQISEKRAFFFWNHAYASSGEAIREMPSHQFAGRLGNQARRVGRHTRAKHGSQCIKKPDRQLGLPVGFFRVSRCSEKSARQRHWRIPCFCAIAIHPLELCRFHRARRPKPHPHYRPTQPQLDQLLPFLEPLTQVPLCSSPSH